MRGENHPQSRDKRHAIENDVHERRETRGTKRDYRRVVRVQEGGTVDRGVELPVLPASHKEKREMERVVDMRHVNQRCVEDSYPLPRIEDLLVQQEDVRVIRSWTSRERSIRSQWDRAAGTLHAL